MKKIIGLFGLGTLLAASAAWAAPLEKAAFAAGCFWGTEEFFRKMDGVVKTEVGYEGGDKPTSYDQVGMGTTGHAETLELEYDPSKISYGQLLERFFNMHDPTTANRQGNDRGPQYRSAIFVHSDAQMKEAQEFKAKVEKSGAWKKPVVTEITKAKTFYPAEKEHQDYLEKHPGGYDNHFDRHLSFDIKTRQEKSK